MHISVLLQDLRRRFPAYSVQRLILVDAVQQCLLLIDNGQAIGSWVISTAEAGLGNCKNSSQTPLGVHRIAQCFGEGAPLGAIFKARQNTGKVAEILTTPGVRSQTDNITTRILWLDGLEPGVNKGGAVDSFERYIYIHGTNEEGRLGVPASHGCVRMSNQDIVDLYHLVVVDTLVVIVGRSVTGY